VKNLLSTINLCLLLALAVLTASGVGCSKPSRMSLLNQHRKELNRLLGPPAESFLQKSEITAWTPDLNQKPQTYFMVTAATREEFTAWTAAAGLTTTKTPTIPSGVWKLPSDVKIKEWSTESAPDGETIDAAASTSPTTVWSRWKQGMAYTVVYPNYGEASGK
jgi:hypothetical protein